MIKEFQTQFNGHRDNCCCNDCRTERAHSEIRFLKQKNKDLQEQVEELTLGIKELSCDINKMHIDYFL